MASRASLALLALCASPVVAAELLNDPTKPPAELSAPSGAVVTPGNALQTIIISSNRRAAIIDGQTVELGAKHGDVRLIEVTESGVVLEGSQGRQVLALFPGVDIKKNTSPSSVEQKVKRVIRKEKPVEQPIGDTGRKEKK